MPEVLNVTEAYIREYPEEFLASTVETLSSVVPAPVLAPAPAKEEDPLSREVANRNAGAIAGLFGSIPGAKKAHR